MTDRDYPVARAEKSTRADQGMPEGLLNLNALPSSSYSVCSDIDVIPYDECVKLQDEYIRNPKASSIEVKDLIKSTFEGITNNLMQ